MGPSSVMLLPGGTGIFNLQKDCAVWATRPVAALTVVLDDAVSESPLIAASQDSATSALAWGTGVHDSLDCDFFCGGGSFVKRKMRFKQFCS